MPPITDPALQKVLAEREAARMAVDRAFSDDQVSSMAKWLMASLLAVNGGGALAALNIAKTAPMFWLPGAIFGAGIGIALLSGVAMQEFSQFFSSANTVIKTLGEALSQGARKQ